VETSGDAAVCDIAADPICTSVLVDEETGDEKDNLDQEVDIHASVADVCEWMCDIGGSVLAAEDLEAI